MTLNRVQNESKVVAAGHSVGAVAVGILSAAVLSLSVDEVLHRLGIFAPWGEVTYAAWPFALAVTYRSLFGVLGFYLTTRLAPRNPMRHLKFAAGVAAVLSVLGVAAALAKPMGPVWYPVALALTTLPCAFLAAALYRMRDAARLDPSLRAHA